VFWILNAKINRLVEIHRQSFEV